MIYWVGIFFLLMRVSLVTDYKQKNKDWLGLTGYQVWRRMRQDSDYRSSPSRALWTGPTVGPSNAYTLNYASYRSINDDYDSI